MNDEIFPVSFINITENNFKQRIDNFLKNKFKSLSRNTIYKIVRTGQVRINKKRIKPNYQLKYGDIIRIPPMKIKKKTLIKSPKYLIKSNTLINNIVYEDNYLLILNKPSGLAVHSGSGVNFGIIEYLRIFKPKERYLDLVHRLDRDTSGILMIAKKHFILKDLNQQLRNKSIEKKYLALVHGVWPKMLTFISQPILKIKSNQKKQIVKIHKIGKPSITKFKINKIYTNNTLLSITPITGRTHQIRVHTLYANHPIVLDTKYGKKNLDNQIKKKINVSPRLLLHANCITFIHPHYNKKMTVNAPLDDIFQSILKDLS